MKSTLTKPISNLTSYVEFCNKLQQNKVQFVKLNEQKKKFEEMKAVLGKYRIKDENAYQNSSRISQLQTKIDLIGDELLNVEILIRNADETALSQKESNVEQLTSVIQQEQEKLVDLIEKIESETLMSKVTPHREALLELKKLEQKFDGSIEKIDSYKSFETTLGVPAASIPQIYHFQVRFKRRHTIWFNWDTF